ncbi:MAG: TlpA family protein disulfide reductase [Acidimicrobiales bacterium]
MGAQDDFGFAQEFQATTGTNSFTMTWDASFDTWRYYQVTGQPTAILVDKNGQPIQGWRGLFPEDEVLEAARAAS